MYNLVPCSNSNHHLNNKARLHKQHKSVLNDKQVKYCTATKIFTAISIYVLILLTVILVTISILSLVHLQHLSKYIKYILNPSYSGTLVFIISVLFILNIFIYRPTSFNNKHNQKISLLQETALQVITDNRISLNADTKNNTSNLTIKLNGEDDMERRKSSTDSTNKNRYIHCY